MTPWTPERTALLRQLHADRLPPSKIALQLGTTRNAVIGKLVRIGLMGSDKCRTRSAMRYRVKRRKYTPIERGDWDAKTFEPYAVRKVRLAMEREAGHGL